MSSTRLTPAAMAADPTDGLRARIHDPLCLLGRQWQFGEFKGDDAGSSASVEVLLETSPIDQYWPELPNAGGQAGTPYRAAALPLECLVEREVAASRLATAVEAGLELRHRLGSAGFGAVIPALLQPPWVLKRDQSTGADDGAPFVRAFADLVSGRVIDGAALHAALARQLAEQGAISLSEIPSATLNADEQSRLVTVLTAWMNWYADLYGTAAASAWIPEHLEYAFAVGARTTEGTQLLGVPEYFEGHLDWYAFRRAGLRPGEAQPEPIMSRHAATPTPVAFRGMPLPRFWEFEDGGVNFAQVETHPDDPARLLVLAFALEYGNDWFIVPLDTPVGSLCRIRSLSVANTFGERIEIRHAAAADGLSAWRMYALSPDLDREGQDADRAWDGALLLPPSLGHSLESAPIEDVLLLHDEMANMAWAVEKAVDSEIGPPVDRYEQYQAKQRRRDAEAGPASKPSGQRLHYRLGPEVPDYWIPLVPVRYQGTLRLQRAALPKFERGEVTGPMLPEGRILCPESRLLLFEEEIPREGVRVTRAYQYARWSDGSTHLWIGRRKRPGRGEGSSGLRFDSAEPG